MNLARVTITGADDNTSVTQLLDLSDEYEFVEWGILVSRSQAGGYRFLSERWMEQLASEASPNVMISMHLCGDWVRQLLMGVLDWSNTPGLRYYAQRIQINTHAIPHLTKIDMFNNMEQLGDREFIMQADGVMDHLAYAGPKYGVNCSILFDTSHGAGISPTSWPRQIDGFYCGYAGGIGPQNIAEELKKIEALAKRPYWIDMESRVRSRDDSVLQIAKIRSVLSYCSKFINGDFDNETP